MKDAHQHSELSSVHAIFVSHAKQAPGRIALSLGANRLTYGELDAWSQEIATKLVAAQVGRGALVGLFMERSFELVAAIIAILKVGAAYVPLDPDYPPDRIDFIAKDSGATVILLQPHLRSRLPQSTAQLIAVEPAGLTPSPAIEPQSTVSPPLGSPDDLAYVMYTSGSTGIPKGVAIPHRGIVRLVCGADFFQISPDDVFLLLAPVSFDASTFEIWGALLNGARVEITPPGQPSLQEIGEVIRTAHVSILWLTAGLFNLMVEERLQDLAPVRQLLTGGDVLSVTHIRRALAELPSTQLINGYGPTENTTFTCCHTIPRDLPAGRSVPIGRAIRGTTVHIVNEQLREVADGDEGELLTGGLGLALGYWNRAELTAERFVPNPFSTDPHDRLYRTGDQVRRLPDGTLEFLGRRDSQVKLRGYRIELGEIESAIRQHAAVRDCVVKVGSDAFSNLQLCAYVVRREAQEISAVNLRTFLASHLPEYMVPSGWMFLDQLPLNPNGKVDRARLPEVTGMVPAGKPPEPPQNEMEKMIAAVWQELLGRPVDVTASFFELGANSLLVTRVHERLQRLNQLTLPLTDMFRFPTIRSLSAHLQKPLVPANNNTPVPSADRAPLRRAALDRFKKKQA